jgi:hypothetical protein
MRCLFSGADAEKKIRCQFFRRFIWRRIHSSAGKQSFTDMGAYSAVAGLVS